MGKKKDYGWDCQICCESLPEEKRFHCPSCKEEYCISCFKHYLLNSIEDPHCLHCRSKLLYDQFVETFDKTWRLGIYKKHKEKILSDQEIAMIPATMDYFDKLQRYERMKEERDRLQRELHQMEIDIEDLHYEMQTGRPRERYVYQNGQYQLIKKEVEKPKYKWTQPCPDGNCRGFMNEDHFCSACNKTYCKDCLVHVIDKEKHACDEDLKATIKMIKRESKPCPNCNEFISKISGCDQMFCTGCGTAFSWTTGQVERGTIHNPHAHQFFKNNPEALELYRRQQELGTQRQTTEGGCRPLIPPYLNLQHVPTKVQFDINMNIRIVHRYLAEYNQYHKPRIERQIQEETGDALKNRDLRIRYLKKELDDTHFKSILHARYKKLAFRRQVHDIVTSTNMILGGMLWAIMDVRTNEEWEKIWEMMREIRNSTNEILRKISKEHNYKQVIQYNEHFKMDEY